MSKKVPALLVLGIFFSLCCVAQEDTTSVVLGRSFLCINVSPVTSLPFGRQPTIQMIYKKGRPDPCYRSRFGFAFRESEDDDQVFNGNYLYQPGDTSFTRVRPLSGTTGLTWFSLGMERVFPRRFGSFLAGADLILGRRQEERYLELNYFNYNNCDTCSGEPRYIHSRNTHEEFVSLQAGLSPFVGFEKDIAERWTVLLTADAQLVMNRMMRYESDELMLLKPLTIFSLLPGRLSCYMVFRF